MNSKNCKYELINAKKEHIPKIKQYKLSTIFEYAVDISEEEKPQIYNYVDNSIPKWQSQYQMIVVNNLVVGNVLVTPYEDGSLLDEIYIEEGYRNQGIGSSILENIVNQYSPLYLWVYKENKKAIRLYEKFGFEIWKETETRFLMKR